MKKVELYSDNININEKDIAIILGYFDGVHLGHKEIIQKAINKTNLDLAILTFDKPVSTFINNGKSKEVLTSLDDKFSIINRYGVDYFYVQHIDEDFLSMSAIEFIDYLKKLNVKEIYVGEDYKFGKNASGDIKLLKKYFDVFVINCVTFKGKKISTQTILNEIKNGHMAYSNSLMGQNYKVSGIVVEGHQNGSRIGIKTANIKLNDDYVIPRYGVYKVITHIEGSSYRSLANVGVHPTIDEENSPLIEVHIPNIDIDFYGKNIQVEFLDFIRPEMRFKSVQELVSQIKKDLTLLDK